MRLAVFARESGDTRGGSAFDCFDGSFTAILGSDATKSGAVRAACRALPPATEIDTIQGFQPPIPLPATAGVIFKVL
jgi:hypothetical protein